MPTYKPYDVFDPQRMNTPSDMQTYIDRLPYFNKTVKITLPFTFTEVKHFLSFLKSIDCDEQTIQNKKISLPELREKIRDYCLDFFVDIQDVSWDDFSWEHIRHLQYDLDEYNVVTGFDDEQQQMMYLSNFKTDIEVSVELFSMIDQIQQAFKSPGKDIVDFDMTGGGAVHSHRVQEEGNRAERDIFSRAPYETIHSDKSLSPYEKFRRMYTYTIWWMRKKQQQGEIFSAKVHYYVCEMINLTTDQWKALSVSHQVAIISLVFSSLLLTTKTPHENSLPADYLDKNITNIPQETKEEIAQIVKKNLEKSGAQEPQKTHGDQTEKTKDQVQKTLTTTTPTPPKPAKDVKDIKNVKPAKDVKDIKDIKDIKDVKPAKDVKDETTHGRKDTVTHLLTPRIIKITTPSAGEIAHFTATTPLLEVDFDGIPLLKDTKSEVYYIRYKKGQSLKAIHNTLKKYAQFAHLNKKNYRLLWNIDPKKISDGQIIPVPVDNQETILTHKELKKIAGEAIDALKKNPTYGEFMKNLEKTHKKKNLVRLMCLIAEKETNLGATSMYRNEPHLRQNSGCIWQILYGGPGKLALDTLGFTWGEVSLNPLKGGMWFWAYCYEKSMETGSPKPYSFFGLDNLKEFGTRYNGATRYGAALEASNN